MNEENPLNELKEYQQEILASDKMLELQLSNYKKELIEEMKHNKIKEPNKKNTSVLKKLAKIFS